MNKIHLLSAGLSCVFLAGCGTSSEAFEKSERASAVALPSAVAFQESGQWVRPDVAENPSTRLLGEPLASYEAGLERLTKAPFNKDFILADVNFNQVRWFTHFSGDISGRFIEVASNVSSADEPWPEVLNALLDEIAQYQKEDGHFGAEVDWEQEIDFDPTTDRTVMMPILWGNGRLLLGLTAAAMKFDHPGVKEAARKLGDFYVNTVYPRFCDPERVEEYRTEGQYASAYVTCVYEGMEGLLDLYKVTGERRYLESACKFADFHEEFDVLPVGHSHGSLSQTSMLVKIYEESGQEKYIKRAVERWDAVVTGGYVNPAGSVLEKFWVTGYNRDEGCSEADWLRLNLLLWSNTGQTRYLDMAERLYWNGIQPNQWSTGGYGHRFMGIDDVGPFAYLKQSQESLWCCSFHVPWALHKMLSFLAVGSEAGIWYNFPIGFETAVDVGEQAWIVKSNPAEDASGPNLIAYNLELLGTPGAAVPPLHVRMPDWAQDVKVRGWKYDRETKEELEIEFALAKSELPGRNVLTVTTSEKITADTLTYQLLYTARPFLEDRRLQRVDLEKALEEKVERLEGVAYRQGPHVYMNKSSGAIEDIELSAVNEKMGPFVEMEDRDDPHAFVINLLLESGTEE